MENPCIKCIVLAACKAKSRKSQHVFIAWAGARCELFQAFVMDSASVINMERANELGRLFNYKLTSRGKYHYGKSLQKLSD